MVIPSVDCFNAKWKMSRKKWSRDLRDDDAHSYCHTKCFLVENPRNFLIKLFPPLHHRRAIICSMRCFSVRGRNEIEFQVVTYDHLLHRSRLLREYLATCVYASSSLVCMVWENVKKKMKKKTFVNGDVRWWLLLIVGFLLLLPAIFCYYYCDLGDSTGWNWSIFGNYKLKRNLFKGNVNFWFHLHEN